MKNYFTLLLVPLLFTSVALAQMQLRLSNDLEQQYLNSPQEKLKSNMELNLPAFSTSSPDAIEFYKGLLMLGFLADVTFPIGGEEDFGHIAGTGFSGHVVLSYLLNPQVLLALRAGYIKFGTQTEEGSEQGYTYRYEDSFSQIPILLGAYYLFSSKGSFRPYLGLALGVFIQNYAVKWEEEYFGDTWSLDESFSNTGFGLVPELGFYYILGSIILQASAGYNLVLSDAPAAEYGDGEQTYTEETGKANSVSVNVGLSFPIGGK
jgi:outer membrane protein W